MLAFRAFITRLVLRCNPALWGKVKKIEQDVFRRSGENPKHHWIFDHFSAFRGEVPTNFHVTYIGDRVRDDIVDWEGHRNDVATAPDLPPFDCEYFEWLDILETVYSAGRTFTMLELGAGYGRWTSRAALAAAQLGKSVRFGLVESDPKHLIWLKQCMEDNGIKAENYKCFEGVVAGKAGKCMFQIELPESAKVKNWFGQAIAQKAGNLHVDSELHYGYKKMCSHEGAFIEVRQFALSDILREFEDIDIVHIDIQGAEADAIQEGARMLKQKAKRLNIGTHGHDIEARLRRILSSSGWVCLRDYPCSQTNETIFGRISFVDGLQTWVNPSRI